MVCANSRAVTYNHDEMYRRTDITETADSSSIAKWSFWGPGRVAELSLGNGQVCTWLNNTRTNAAVQSDVANPAWGECREWLRATRARRVEAADA